MIEGSSIGDMSGRCSPHQFHLRVLVLLAKGEASLTERTSLRLCQGASRMDEKDHDDRHTSKRGPYQRTSYIKLCYSARGSTDGHHPPVEAGATATLRRRRRRPKDPGPSNRGGNGSWL